VEFFILMRLLDKHLTNHLLQTEFHLTAMEVGVHHSQSVIHLILLTFNLLTFNLPKILIFATAMEIITTAQEETMDAQEEASGEQEFTHLIQTNAMQHCTMESSDIMVDIS